MILPYVYRLTHRDSGHFYIGYRCKNVSLALSSSNDLGITYFTSSKLINKNNIDQYEIEIIAEFYHSDDAYDLEQDMIRDSWENDLLINDHYHYKGAGRWKNPGHSTETRKKISDARKGHRASAEVRQKMSDSRKGRKLSQQAKENIAAAKTGDKNPNFGK